MFKYGLTTLDMKANGEKTRPTVEESSGTPTAISMRASGKMTRQMATESTST